MLMESVWLGSSRGTRISQVSDEASSAPLEAGATTDILGRTAAGAGWTVGWRMATRLLGLLSTLILTRLLMPSDFGLIALGSSFVVALDAVSTLGIEDALVREKAPGRELYDTGFTLNLIRSASTGAILAACALPTANFFREPRLADVLLALALGTIAGGLTNIGIVDFRRDFSFDKEFRLLIVPRLAGVLTTVAAALLTRSYLALIAGILTSRGLAVMLSYAMHPYRPRLSLRAWRHLAGFSVWTWALGTAALIRDRGDGFLIGWSLDAAQVGIYSVGTEIADLPTTELVAPLGRACFSGFAAARHAGEESGQTYLRVVAVVTLLTFPIAVGISLLADPVVKLAFGSQWLEAIPVVQVAALFCSTTVFGQISNVLFGAHAMLRSLFVITLAGMMLRVVLLIVLLPHYGILGAAFAAGISMLCEYAVYVELTLRRFGLRLSDLWRRIWRPLVATVVMAASLHVLGLGWNAASGDAASLACGIVIAAGLGAGIYVSTMGALWCAAACPAGAETDALLFAKKLFRRNRRLGDQASPG